MRWVVSDHGVLLPWSLRIGILWVCGEGKKGEREEGMEMGGIERVKSMRVAVDVDVKSNIIQGRPKEAAYDCFH